MRTANGSAFGTPFIKKKGLCLPKDDLDVAYLAKKKPLSPDTVLNEYTKDSSGITKHYGKFDGTVYGDGGSNPIHNGNNIHSKVIFRQSAFASGASALISKFAGTEKELMAYQDGTTGLIHIYYTTNGASNLHLTLASPLLNQWNFLDFSFIDGTLTATLNGITYTQAYSGTIFSGSSNLELGEYAGHIGAEFVGDIAYAKLGNAEFKFDDTYGTTTVVNTGTAGGDATLTGATLSNFWNTDYSTLKMVKTGYGKGNGSVNVVGDSTPIHNGTNVDFELILKPDFTTNYETFFSKYTSTTYGEFIFYQFTSGSVRTIYLGLVDSSDTYVQTAVFEGSGNNEWIKIKGNFNAGELTWTVNDGVEQSSTLTISDIKTNSTANTTLFGSIHSSYLDCSGDIAYLKFGSAEFDFTEQSGLKVGDADITNYYDGFWQSANAKLVQSMCAKFDGNTEADAGTEAIHDGVNLNIKLLFKTSSDVTTAASRMVVSKFLVAGNREFAVYQYQDDFKLLLYDASGTQYLKTFTAVLTANTWYNVEFDFKAGALTWDINGITGSETAPISTIAQSTAELVLGGRSDTPLRYIGNISYIKAGNAEFNFAEGAGATLYNTGTAGGNATLTGATLSDFWSERQDIYHYNILNGFSTSLIFDGVDDYVEFPTIDTSGTPYLHISIDMEKHSASESVCFQQFVDNTTYVQLLWHTDGKVYAVVSDGTSNYGYCSVGDTGRIKATMVYQGYETGNINRLQININGVDQTLTFVGTLPAVVPDLSSVKPTLGKQGPAYIKGIIHSVHTRGINGELISSWKCVDGGKYIDSIDGDDGIVYGCETLRIPAKNSTHDILDNELTNPAGK